MKIFIFEGNYPSYNPYRLPNTDWQNASFLPSNPCAHVETPFYTVPDTALLQNHKPFFIPDYATECVAQLHLVVRISRLGKNIAQQFAYRYYETITLGVAFTAHNLFDKLYQLHLPWELSKSFDGSAVVGEWISKSSIEEKIENTMNLNINKEHVLFSDLSKRLHAIEEQIAFLSQFYKLCQGDLIFTGCSSSGIKVSINQQVSGCLNNQELLRFNIK